MSKTVGQSLERLDPQETRALKIIREAILRLELSLDGLTVLTEVGTNNYLYTPIIAALAGANKVYAWTGDTSHGAGEDTVRMCAALASKLRVADRIEFSNNAKNPAHISAANIITNSGFLRPLNREFLSQLNADRCVIPLMYEAWECRETDIDINACRDFGVKVGGTWENHPSIGVFDATGPLSVKLAMEAGFEVYRNKIAVWSADHFGRTAKKSFEALGAASVLLTSDRSELHAALPDLDFVFFCDYEETSPIVGSNGVLALEKILTLNPGIGIVHLFGGLNFKDCIDSGLRAYPLKDGYPAKMTETLAYLGPEPSLNLTVAGLKVGQLMLSSGESSLLQPLWK